MGNEPVTYVAVVGFDHDPSETRVDEGEPVPADLPEKVIKHLLAEGAITKAKRKRGS